MESLRTKGNAHSNLDIISGVQQIEQKYFDSDITDSFIVMERYRSAEDSEGNCYDWYVITSHNRYIDKYTPNIGAVKEEILSIQEQLLANEMAGVSDELGMTEDELLTEEA